MSGPFGVDITVISGQQSSGEVVVAASTFLSMGYLSISLVGKHGYIRQEFLKALEVFGIRERIYYHDSPVDFAERLIEPSNSISISGMFWLALDQEGKAIAESIFAANGEPPDKLIYKSVHKLNLLEPTIAPPPQGNLPLHLWEESRRQHFSLSLRYRKLKPQKSYHSFMREHAPLLPEQELYCAWCESLYESLIPWQDTIRNIQSDFS